MTQVYKLVLALSLYGREEQKNESVKGQIDQQLKKGRKKPGRQLKRSKYQKVIAPHYF